jgi:MSHA biogenesis protein MshK
MAADLMKRLGLVFFMLCGLVASTAWAQVLSDPTRPPPGIGDPAQSPGMMSYPQEKGLQSVIISPEHCAAIIDGKTIELGGKYGEQTLVEITEQGVVLQGELGRHALVLFPAVGMKITAVSSGQQAIKCKAGQNRQAKSPAKKAVQKERK